MRKLLHTAKYCFMSVLLLGSASALAFDPAAECDALAGQIVGEQCLVTTVEQFPWMERIRAAGKSGLAWTKTGIEYITTIDSYSIEVMDIEYLEETSTTIAFVAGSNPQHQSCKVQNGNDPKCDRFVEITDTVTTEIPVYDWVYQSTDISSEIVVTACYNPGGRNMGALAHCGK